MTDFGYPPARTGMRGCHPGSFDVSHAVRDGKRYALDDVPVEEAWDLVVVGAGNSGRMVGPGGFDADRDILAITVNRWGHGYPYMGDPLFEEDRSELDPWYVTARRPIGRVAIANADAEWSAFTHVAIKQAHRAVGELLGDPREALTTAPS